MERFICHNIFGDVVCTYTVLWRWYSAHANISRFGMKLCYALKRWNECKNAKDERQRLVNTYDCSAADEKTLHSPMQEYTCIHLTTIYIHITHYYDLHHGCYITRRREISVQTFMEKLFVNILHEKVRNMTRSKRENTIKFFFLYRFMLVLAAYCYRRCYYCLCSCLTICFLFLAIDSLNGTRKINILWFSFDKNISNLSDSLANSFYIDSRGNGIVSFDPIDKHTLTGCK